MTFRLIYLLCLTWEWTISSLCHPLILIFSTCRWAGWSPCRLWSAVSAFGKIDQSCRCCGKLNIVDLKTAWWSLWAPRTVNDYCKLGCNQDIRDDIASASGSGSMMRDKQKIFLLMRDLILTFSKSLKIMEGAFARKENTDAFNDVWYPPIFLACNKEAVRLAKSIPSPMFQVAYT